MENTMPAERNHPRRSPKRRKELAPPQMEGIKRMEDLRRKVASLRRDTFLKGRQDPARREFFKNRKGETKKEGETGTEAVQKGASATRIRNIITRAAMLGSRMRWRSRKVGPQSDSRVTVQPITPARTALETARSMMGRGIRSLGTTRTVMGRGIKKIGGTAKTALSKRMTRRKRERGVVKEHSPPETVPSAAEKPVPPTVQRGSELFRAIEGVVYSRQTKWIGRHTRRKNTVERLRNALKEEAERNREFNTFLGDKRFKYVVVNPDGTIGLTNNKTGIRREDIVE